MVYIDVIKICKDIGLYSVIISRLDETEIISSAFLETSLKNAELKVSQKKKHFETANRKVIVRWHD